MAIKHVKLNFSSINASAQVGDIAYCSSAFSVLGAFNSTGVTSTRDLGPIISIETNCLVVEIDDDLNPLNSITGSFISFVKDKKVNTSSLLGYYADVKFKNYSTSKAELFSVGSEITESSK